MGCSITSYTPPPRTNTATTISKNAIKEFEGFKDIDGKRNPLILFIILDKGTNHAPL